MFGSRLVVKRFEDRIQKYESVPIQEGKILFYGDSYFTRCSWITNFQENPKLEDCVRMKDGSQAIVNHGFGTSSADDLLYYYDRMVRPWKPRALVLTTGSNDIGFGYTPLEVMEILARIVQWAQADFPGIPIYCFSQEPLLKHKGVDTVGIRSRDEYNALLEAFCARTENCIFFPTAMQPFYYEDPADIGNYSKIREDIFHEDRTHLNPKGYALFMDSMRELLDDLL